MPENLSEKKIAVIGLGYVGFPLAVEFGYHPEVILAGRRINDGMGSFVANEVSRLMMKKGMPVVESRILLMGLAFKENCPDLRNSKVIDVIKVLQEFNAKIDVYDPWVDHQEALREYGVNCLTGLPEANQYDGIILAVGHQEFFDLGISGIRAFGKDDVVIYDVKGLFPKHETDGRL